MDEILKDKIEEKSVVESCLGIELNEQRKISYASIVLNQELEEIQKRKTEEREEAIKEINAVKSSNADLKNEKTKILNLLFHKDIQIKQMQHKDEENVKRKKFNMLMASTY